MRSNEVVFQSRAPCLQLLKHEILRKEMSCGIYISLLSFRARRWCSGQQKRSLDG